MKLSPLLLAIACLFCLHSFGQQKETKKVKAADSAKINFKDVEKKEKSGLIAPKAKPKRALNENDDKLPHHLPLPKGAKVKLHQVNPPKGGGKDSLRGKSNHGTAAEQPFPGLHDNNTLIPPDLGGAAGPTYVMETLNTQVQIQDKSGNVISTVTLDAFFSSLSGLTEVYDPKILYDPFDQRWILTAPANPGATSSTLCLGISATNDPTGNWSVYSFTVDATGTNWFDYPSIGFNKNWIVVTGNLFSVATGAYAGEILFMFDKESVYAGTTTPTVTTNPASAGFTLVPAITLDNTANDLPLVEDYNGSSGGNGYLQLFSITGTAAAPVLNTPMIFPSVTQPWNSSGSGGADFAPQNTVTNKIQNNDSRMQDAIYRNGSLWCTQTVFLPAAAPTHSAIQWWQMDPATGTVQQFGRVEDATANFFYAFPSIAVNAYGDFMLGYGSFSAGQFASCNYSFHAHTDAANTTQPTVQFKAGAAKYYKIDTKAHNRWGDYTSTCIDPDDFSFWTLQEFADNPSGGVDQWNTEWNRIVPPVSDLYIQDIPADMGEEPDASTLPMWQSQDIWLRVIQDPTFQYAHISQDAQYNSGTANPNYVYAEVRNRGGAASAGTEQLTVYWAKASSALSWPDPWNGGVYFDPGPNTMLMGQVIGTQTIPAIAAGATSMFQFAWNPPDPSLYATAFGGDQNHFCLLARITTSTTAPFGMTFPETSDLTGNVRNNNHIAQKNIDVYDAAPGGGNAPSYAVIGNLQTHPIIARLRFQLQDSAGNNTLFERGGLRVTFTGKMKDILTKGKVTGQGFKEEGNGVFEIDKADGYLDNISLDPREFGTLEMQYTPTDGVQPAGGWAITIVQIENVSGKEHIIGGQTAVYGSVKGFGTAPSTGSITGLFHQWYIWIILLIILFLIILILLKRRRS